MQLRQREVLTTIMTKLTSLAPGRVWLVTLLRHRFASWGILAAIIAVAILFRCIGLNWDEDRHLHPDERFLSTVTNDITWPESFESYFDPNTSTLSPYALPDVGLYVYGMLPVYVTKWTAVVLDRNTYDEITYIGRIFSALSDIGAIVFLFLIGRRLYGTKVGLLGAALLSLTVLNIQLSHFYAVDTFDSGWRSSTARIE